VTPEQAELDLPGYHKIHVIQRIGFIDLGADWTWPEVKQMLRKADLIEPRDPNEHPVDHGIQAFCRGTWHFVETA
jgi:hypothetical protein